MNNMNGALADGSQLINSGQQPAIPVIGNFTWSPVVAEDVWKKINANCARTKSGMVEETFPQENFRVLIWRDANFGIFDKIRVAILDFCRVCQNFHLILLSFGANFGFRV